MFDTFTIPVYKHPRTGELWDDHEVIHDEYEGPLEPESYDELEFSHMREAEWISVAVYEMDRSYGGAEEGGWYYDTGSRVRGTTREFTKADFPQVKEWVALMIRRYPPNKKFGYVNYGVRTYYEQAAPSSFPQHTPRYS